MVEKEENSGPKAGGGPSKEYLGNGFARRVALLIFTFQVSVQTRVMSFNLLSVPLRTSKPIPLGESLKELINNQYYQTSAAFKSDIEEIDQLRNDVLSIEPNNDGLALLKRYYVQLASISQKLPDYFMEYPWFGTLGYQVTGPVALKSLYFERINIAYNIAATYSIIGLNEPRATGEGLKKSCIYFQYSSGAFESVLKLVEQKPKELTLPIDLSVNIMKTLAKLMLAQAQECFWQKAVSNTLKDNVIARLAFQVSQFYDEALSMAYKCDILKSEWIEHMSCKKLHFKAAAQFRLACVAVAASRHGEEIARLRIANTICETASREAKYHLPSVSSDLESLSKIIKDSLRRSERDNDLIYLQEVPNESDLPPIVAASMVEPKPIVELNSAECAKDTKKYGKILFHDLMPYLVIEIAQAFRERQDSYVVKHIKEPMEMLTKILHTILAENGLPALIDTIQRPQRLPTNILEHCQILNERGGMDKLKVFFEDISKLRHKSEQVLQNCVELLQMEESENEEMRRKHGSQRWNFADSREASADVRKSVQALEGYLKQAHDGDQVIWNDFEQLKPLLSMMSAPNSTKLLEEFVPNSKFVRLPPELNRIVNELRADVNQVKKLASQRETFINTVKVKSTDLSILPLVVSHYKKLQQNNINTITTELFEEVFRRQVSNFDSDIRFVQKHRDNQIELEKHIKSLVQQFNQLRGNIDASQERQNALQLLDDAYNGYLDLVNNLTQGLSFYNDFTGKANDVYLRCQEFYNFRKQEAMKLEQEIYAVFEQGKSPQKKQLEDQVSDQPKSEVKSSKGYSNELWNPDVGIKFG